MANGKYEFHGTGLGLLGLMILNLVLCILTIGLYGPWAYVSMQRWYCKHTTVDGRVQTFKGSGAGFFGQYLLICFLTLITLTIYTPWGICRLKRWQTQNTYFADPGDNEA